MSLLGFCAGSLICGVIFDVLSSLVIILLRKRAACFYLKCIVAVCVLCLFLRVGLQPVIVVFPVFVAFHGHTHFLADICH